MGGQVKLDKKEYLERLISRWKDKQGSTRSSAEALHKRTKSYFVRIVSNAIKRDSEKNEEILQAILECMDCTVSVTPEELG